MEDETKILGKKLLIISAHPDDEAFLAAGIIFGNKKVGGITHLYSATLGEKGSAYVSPEITEDELKILRKSELEEAGKYLGIQKIILDTFPDRDLEHNQDQLEIKIKELINIEKPDYVLGFGKNGYTGHKDHIVIGMIAQKISLSQNIPYLEFSHPPKALLGDISQFLMKKRANGNYFDEIEDSEPNIAIAVDENVKLTALKIYQSQLPGLDPHIIFPKDIANHLILNEYFTLRQP